MRGSEVERIAALETELSYLKDEIQKMNEKLDSLLALRYKGAGAFMLASSLFGLLFTGLLAYFSGKGH